MRVVANCAHEGANVNSVIGWLSAPRAVDGVRPSDYETLEEIHAASFVSPWSADEQAALNEAPGVRTLVARRGSAGARCRPVGFITVRHAADEAEILTMAVHPRHRNAGIGRLLLDAALRHLYAARVVAVFLEVDPANEPALTLYRRAGFTVVGERADYYPSGRSRGARSAGERAGATVATQRRKAVTMRLALKEPALLRH